MQDQREYLKLGRKGLYSKIGLNMTAAEEEASIKRVLRIRYNAINIAGLNLNQVKNYLVGEIEEELFYLIPMGASVQTIQRILYGKSGWDQTQIDTFELQHDPQNDADIFELRLTEAVAATLYDEYVGPRDVEKKPEKPKSRNRFPQRKRKSPRKDRNQSIEELDVSDSELTKLVESKELHEEWAAFRLEHRETIKNHLSDEDYGWLELEIPQAVKPIGLRTPAELWERGKGSSRLLLTEIKNNNKNIIKAKEGVKITQNKINSLEKKLKNIASPTKIGKLRGQERSGDAKKRKKAQTKLKQIRKDQVKTKGEIDHMQKEGSFFQKLLDKLTKRNKKLKRFLRISSKKTRGRILTPQEAETVIFW